LLLPTKGLSAERALLTVGSEVLPLLERPTSVSGLWDRFASRRTQSRSERITFDWFSLSLTALYAMGLIDWTAEGQLERRRVSP
jgi:hypothetical protein